MVGVVGPPTLDRDEWLEWPSRVWFFLRGRAGIGPPLSETGSNEVSVCDRSWLTMGRGRREVGGFGTGFCVKVMDTAVLGRAGLIGRRSLSLTLRCILDLADPKTSPPRNSRPSKSSSSNSSPGVTGGVRFGSVCGFERGCWFSKPNLSGD